ncbi:MAG: methyltransferase domain-containing protein [Marinobacterium sp.]|nr:methyltransferase domain-containing protein [Marinobacterium sp.]
MESEQQKWDRRYRDKALLLPTPQRFIEQSAAQLMPGTVLDLASGDGANSLYLARKGFDVIAADISSEALERLNYFAVMLGVEIRTVQLDVDQPDWVEMLNEVEPGVINNMVMTWFKPWLPLWHQMAERLAPEGNILLSTYNIQQHHKHGFNADYCLRPAEYTGVVPSLSTRYSASVVIDDSYTDEYIFQKQAVQQQL